GGHASIGDDRRGAADPGARGRMGSIGASDAGRGDGETSEIRDEDPALTGGFTASTLYSTAYAATYASPPARIHSRLSCPGSNRRFSRAGRRGAGGHRQGGIAGGSGRPRGRHRVHPVGPRISPRRRDGARLRLYAPSLEAPFARTVVPEATRCSTGA